MAERQRWVRGAHRRDAHAPDAGVVKPFSVVLLVVQDQDLLIWAVPHVEQQPTVALGVGMGDIGQADDCLVGVYAAAPFPQQVVVHLLDLPERAVLAR